MSKFTSACTYNPIDNTLTLSESFAKKASRPNTPEYRMLLQYRTDCPGLMILKKEKNTKNKHKPDSLTYSSMEHIIGLCEDSKERMKKYQAVRAMSQVQSSPYQFVKRWFDENYANWKSVDLNEQNYTFVPKTRAEMEEAARNAKGIEPVEKEDVAA